MSAATVASLTQLSQYYHFHPVSSGWSYVSDAYYVSARVWTIHPCHHAMSQCQHCWCHRIFYWPWLSPAPLSHARPQLTTGTWKQQFWNFCRRPYFLYFNIWFPCSFLPYRSKTLEICWRTISTSCSLFSVEEMHHLTDQAWSLQKLLKFRYNQQEGREGGGMWQGRERRGGEGGGWGGGGEEEG